MDINELYRRHSQLVDKKFLNGLTAEEALEKQQIERKIDDYEARLFRPLYRWLKKKINQAQRARFEKVG